MRSSSILSVICAATLLVGSAVHAGPLLSATWTQHIQGIDITVTNSGAACTDTLTTHIGQTIVCPVAGLGATGSASANSYSVSLTMPLFSMTQITTGGGGRIPIHTVATEMASQPVQISGTARAALASMGVPGMVTVKVAGHTMKSGYVAGMTTLVKIPLSFGKAGVDTGFFYVLFNLHYLTVDFYPWTPGSVTFESQTSGFVALPTPTLVAMGSFALTAMGGGTLTLVSPSKVSIDGRLAQRRTGSFTSLKLTYAPTVPEPSTLLLLAAGLGLALSRSPRRRPA